MKKFLVLIFILFAGIIFNNKVNALSQSSSFYNVDIEINKDSTFTVAESVEFTFNGEFHGLRRDITLNNAQNAQACANNSNLTCGGFDHINIISVNDLDGKPISPSDLNFYEVNEDDSDYYRIEWEQYPDGKSVSNYKTGWEITYTVYGGIQNIGGYPYFYWNLLPESRGSLTNNSKISIKFPENIQVRESSVELFTSLDYSIFYKLNLPQQSINLNLNNLYSNGPITLAYKFNKGEIHLPASLKYTISNPPLGANIDIDTEQVRESTTSGIITGITSGEHQIRVYRFGYQDIIKNINAEEDSQIDLSFDLQPTPLLALAGIINSVFTIIGVLLIPVSISLVYIHYRRKGRDENFPKTIIPEFNPPDNISPYLLGSLKDESVDKEDIAGSIIDLAYKGYVKIKKLSDNKYELIRTEKSDKDLSEVEKDILQGIFTGNESTDTKKMAATFPYKYYSITQKIYSELVTKGYFKESPQKTTGKYAGCGILVMVFGVIGFIGISAVITGIFGSFSIFTLGFAMAVLGFSLLIAAKYMPAKTELGSKIFAKVLGFRMYMHTAERFRVQKLEPEDFEKYLSYAIVFGIENEWAKKFEGLYNSVPDWYEGDNVGDIYNAYLISSIARSFTNSTVSAFNLPTQSASGSGWSGSSGSFGGFSGGGGGGGSSGGW